MITKSIVSIIFMIVAVILFMAAMWDYFKSKGEKSIARRIWLKMAFIFAAVAVVLFFVNHFLQ